MKTKTKHGDETRRITSTRNLATATPPPAAAALPYTIPQVLANLREFVSIIAKIAASEKSWIRWVSENILARGIVPEVAPTVPASQGSTTTTGATHTLGKLTLHPTLRKANTPLAHFALTIGTGTDTGVVAEVPTWSFEGVIEERDQSEHKANAERIRDLWNLCDGFTIEQIKAALSK